MVVNQLLAPTRGQDPCIVFMDISQTSTVGGTWDKTSNCKTLFPAQLAALCGGEHEHLTLLGQTWGASCVWSRCSTCRRNATLLNVVWGHQPCRWSLAPVVELKQVIYRFVWSFSRMPPRKAFAWDVSLISVQVLQCFFGAKFLHVG